MTDIVERLRDEAVRRPAMFVLTGAAEEIERLRTLSQNNARSWDLIVSERDMFRRALEIIAGIRVSHDNLMGNEDIAREALSTRLGEK